MFLAACSNPGSVAVQLAWRGSFICWVVTIFLQAGDLAIVEYYEPPLHLQKWQSDLDGWMADDDWSDAMDEDTVQPLEQAPGLSVIAVMQVGHGKVSVMRMASYLVGWL